MLFDYASQFVPRCLHSGRLRLGQSSERPSLGWSCRLRSLDSHEGSSRSRSEEPSLPLQGLRTRARSDRGGRGPGHPRKHLTRVLLGSPGPNTGLVSQEGQHWTNFSFVRSFIQSFSKHPTLGTIHCLRSRSASVSCDSEGGPEKYLKVCLLRDYILDSLPSPSAEARTCEKHFLSCHAFFSRPPSAYLCIKEARF